MLCLCFFQRNQKNNEIAITDKTLHSEEGEVNSLLVMMSSIKSSVSDLKGEWVLLKRQFNGIHSENTHLKNTLKSTSELANNTQNMLQSLRQDACYTNKIPTESYFLFIFNKYKIISLQVFELIFVVNGVCDEKCGISLETLQCQTFCLKINIFLLLQHEYNMSH